MRYFVSFGASACAVKLIAWLHDRTNDFTLTFQVLAVFGFMVFLGALAFPHRPDEVEPTPKLAPAE